MKWKEIRKKYPDEFLILSDYKEKRISKYEVEITDAIVIGNYENGNKMMSDYQKLKKNGKDVLFCTPQYKNRFVIEEIPSLRIIR